MAEFDLFIHFQSGYRKTRIKARDIRAAAVLVREKYAGLHNGFLLCQKVKGQRLDEAVDIHGIQLANFKGLNRQVQMQLHGFLVNLT